MAPLHTIESYTTIDHTKLIGRDITSVGDMYSFYLREQKLEASGVGKIVVQFDSNALSQEKAIYWLKQSAGQQFARAQKALAQLDV
ncbi:hypothetical protein [Deminuibacter soli]|uniref:Uncharacterized protein n=1 Tax=Deminuibacter soli TaxID=2291815 RepID=A0A3E1NCA6_9BACT|nr:hypothetical protein [Deminuibacter soli]RFM25645.1 hypothetical protein DXN05_23845 [Deminuibacter soli]